MVCIFCHNKIKGGWCWKGPIAGRRNRRYKCLMGRGRVDERKTSRSGFLRFGGCCEAQDEAEVRPHWTWILICVLRLVRCCRGLSSGQWHNFCFKKSPWTRVESGWSGSGCGWPVGKVSKFFRRETDATWMRALELGWREVDRFEKSQRANK